MRDWQIDYIGLPFLIEGSKCALLCVDSESGLTQAFSCHCGNQVATIRELEKLRIMYGYSHQIDSDGGHISKVMMCKTGKEHDFEWSFHLLYGPQTVVLIERKN